MHNPLGTKEIWKINDKTWRKENLNGQCPRGFFPRGRFSSDFAEGEVCEVCVLPLKHPHRQIQSDK